MKPIYLDNAATTQVAPEVLELVRACMAEDYGNPSSAHAFGIRAETYIERAERQVQAALGDPEGRAGTLIWTSGGTESDALGVLGAARALKRRGRHVLVSSLEHPAVLSSAWALVDEGFEVEELPATASGRIELDGVLSRLREDTVLLAVMLVNNEIGTIQPVAEIAAAAKTQRDLLHVHCDAVQALGKLPLDVAGLGVDSVALAAHKLHGPKGVGVLWLRRGARLAPLWAGGGQQQGVRAGTHNVPGIAGMGAAAQLATADAAALAERGQRWRGFAETLIAAARDSARPMRVHGEDGQRAPHIVSMGFEGVPAEPLLHVLESRGVLVSAGSACSARNHKPSAVLQAIGSDPELGTLRLSFGRDTTADEIDRAAEILRDSLDDFS
ncbi:cysteine desulfurase family protein [Haliangium ochraceum]|uniref:Cysteine desulfurase n=1 Tax=Haliangium ochraceum (strain DSM 14365 / JCM 11303 / SMP-2) TaxID=502025 RepID=D0LKN3_HALO1|nr:cysteine desulfurase family protein [Haliangium ochraceum]ACY15081.1 Cysteine desulfurase [Haliangium ochraceum DSM 14365]